MMGCIWVVDDENVVYTILWEVTVSNLDEKNKRHTSSLVPVIGTSEV